MIAAIQRSVGYADNSEVCAVLFKGLGNCQFGYFLAVFKQLAGVSGFNGSGIAQLGPRGIFVEIPMSES